MRDSLMPNNALQRTCEDARTPLSADVMFPEVDTWPSTL
jgi:hypothetical protein